MSPSTRVFTDLMNHFTGHEEQDVDVTPDSDVERLPSAEASPTKPTVDDFVAATMRETGCDQRQALVTYGWLDEIVKKIKTDSDYPEHATYHPDGEELRRTEYTIVDVIMPHGQSAPLDGTAHDLANRLLLDDGIGNTLGVLVHDDMGKQKRDCTVTIKAFTAG